jgi:hypothetical protein
MMDQTSEPLDEIGLINDIVSPIHRLGSFTGWSSEAGPFR